MHCIHGVFLPAAIEMTLNSTQESVAASELCALLHKVHKNMHTAQCYILFPQ